MLPETGPPPEESISESNNASETPDNDSFQYAGHNGDKDSDSSFKNEGGEVTDNGGPASLDQLEDLRENGIGSKAPEPPEQRPEAVAPEAEEVPPMPVEASVEGAGQTQIRTGQATWKTKDDDRPVNVTGYYGEMDGRQFVTIEGSTTGVPLDELEYPSKEPQGQIISDTEVSPPPPPASQPVIEEPIEETVDLPPLSPEVIAGAQAAVNARNEAPIPETLPADHQPGLRERLFGNIRGVFGGRAKEDTTPVSVAPPPQPEPEQPVWQPPTAPIEPAETPAVEPAIAPTENEETPVVPPPPEQTETPIEEPRVQPEVHRTIEDEVQEKYNALEHGGEVKIGRTNYKVDKIDAEQVGNEQIVRIKLVKSNGETWYRYGHEIKAELEKQVIDERKDATREAEKAAQEQAREEVKKAKEAEKEAKRTQGENKEAEKDRYQQEATRRRETFEERIDAKREELESGKRTHGLMFIEGKQYRFSKFDPEKTDPYAFTDENHQIHHFSTKVINAALGSELTKEDQAALENLKPESRVGQIAGRTLEQVSKGAKQLIETAEKNQVGSFLVRQANAFLNKFDYRDKEKGWYAAGIAVGAGTNVALTAFAPFLAHGPGRILRSAAFSGVLLGVSKGANIFRSVSMNKILSNFGIEDKVERQNYASQFDQAFRLLGSGGEEGYHEAMKKISAEIFTKYGNSQSKTDVEGTAATLSSEELQKRIESLSTKFKNLNNGIRSFSAGLSVGTIGATGFFGLEKFVSHAFDKIPHLGVLGGKPGVPGVPRPSTPTPGVPEHTPTPGVPEPTPTPEVPDHTPGIPDQTPEPGVPAPEIPGLHDILANPDYAHTLEIQQGDTVGSILTNSGYDIDWGSDNAAVFGAHIQANYDMLSNMHDNIAATGMSVEDFPTQAEINTLVAQASAGDPVAMHQLTETMHWIPAGGNFVVLSPEAIELVNNTQGG